MKSNYKIVIKASLKIVYLVLFILLRDQIQVTTQGRQVLYHQATPPAHSPHSALALPLNHC